MDKSDLQAMMRFASQNGIMNRPFLLVFKWYSIQNTLDNNFSTLY